jgi:hypothetical protein
MLQVFAALPAAEIEYEVADQVLVAVWLQMAVQEVKFSQHLQRISGLEDAGHERFDRDLLPIGGSFQGNIWLLDDIKQRPDRVIVFWHGMPIQPIKGTDNQQLLIDGNFLFDRDAGSQIDPRCRLVIPKSFWLIFANKLGSIDRCPRPLPSTIKICTFRSARS